jgi:hypothetical protein
MREITRRRALTIVACGGAVMASGRAIAVDNAGRVIYPVAIPIYQTQFVADRIGFFKEAGLDCKLIQGGSGVKTREIIASSQRDIGIGDITHPMQLSNHGRAGACVDAGRYALECGHVHHSKGPQGPRHRHPGSADGMETCGRSQANRLGFVAGRDQSRLVVILHGNDGARSEGHLDRNGQRRHHVGVTENPSRSTCLSARRRCSMSRWSRGGESCCLTAPTKPSGTNISAARCR